MIKIIIHNLKGKHHIDISKKGQENRFNLKGIFSLLDNLNIKEKQK
jgi:hypothetical protein